jgi:cytochrome bd-type quinol oxidase subunit 2
LRFILRPVGFNLPRQGHGPRWRRHLGLGADHFGGAVAPLLFGVAFGNLFLGVPFHFDALHAADRRIRAASSACCTRSRCWAA